MTEVKTNNEMAWQTQYDRAVLQAEMTMRHANLARALRNIRETTAGHNGPMTQEEAADLVAVPVRTYQRWEAGESFPQRRHLETLERELGLQLEEAARGQQQRAGLTIRIEAMEKTLEEILGLLRAQAQTPAVPEPSPTLQGHGSPSAPPNAQGQSEPENSGSGAPERTSE